ncbi:retrovirus-related pol polyprotein from transposon TNT 1-94 [Tanacetum coccineum]
MLSSFLISNDFSKGSVDPTLFIRREGNELLLVQIYVDDIIFAASTPELCDLFAKIMCSKFKMSMMGKISFFLGLQISQNPRGIFINQSKYALESLKKYGYESCDPVDTPMVEKSKLDEDKEGKAVDPSHYRAWYQARPTEKHLNAVKRIFWYLKGTVHRGLWYPKDSSFALTAFADADHAGCQDTRRSTSGRISIGRTSSLKLLAEKELNFLLNNKLGLRSFTPDPLNNWQISLRLSQAQILWGMYNKKNVDYAYLLWEDFIFQIENKNTKKGNAMYYPRFTKLVVNFVMEKTLNSSRNKLTNEDIRISESYKEYHAIASGKIPPKTKGNDEDSDNEVEGTNVEGAKSDEDATYEEDQGNEAVEDTNTNLDRRDDVMTDVILPRLKALEDNFSELRQTNQYAEALSSIPGIVDQYLANKMQEAVDVAVQLKYDRIREETHTKNQQFLDSIDEGIKKEAKTSHVVAANLSELELKKILIDKMEANNSINRSDIQRQLYKALVDAYEAEKILLDTYGDTVTIKRPRDCADDDQEPSAGTDRGSKRRRSGKEPESTSAPRETTTTIAGKTTTSFKTHKQSASQFAPVEETMQSTDVFKVPKHQEFETGVHDEQAEEEVHHLPDWFQQPKRLPSPDHAWNKSVPAPSMNLQSQPGKIDWINPEGRQYPHDLRQPLPLVPNSQGRRVIPFHHFINNDLEYLRGGVSSRKYSTSVTKTTAADYGHIKWIEDLVPNSMWSQMIVKYDKFALWGISHWGKKRRQFYAFATSRESARDVYSKRRIIAVTKVEIVEWQDYKHLDWITVLRDDDVHYNSKKATSITKDHKTLKICCFFSSVVIQRRVEDLQLGVESYQKKLNLTKPDTYRSNLRRQDAYTPYSDPRGFIYENKDKETYYGAMTTTQVQRCQRDKANARAMIPRRLTRQKTEDNEDLERFCRWTTIRMTYGSTKDHNDLSVCVSHLKKVKSS